ncbi:hypothetical protein QQS21_002235 [Conoideocrella luteorostrata]|uniref:Uncharacterized protein n=1 Tax=Conoideocrella luteorostrata TaxID=1105319 RepID=A0AAJ0FXF2_9HYPO|nr:hypothetical protein QQS21_002235 [Conoideocrella luteorostrata]
MKSGSKRLQFTFNTVINATDYILPAIAIVDSRIKDRPTTVPDFLADNVSTGAVILDGKPRKLRELTMSDMLGPLRFNGETVTQGNTIFSLGNPLTATAWLGEKLAGCGKSLFKGSIVLTESCLKATTSEKRSWKAEFDGFGRAEFDIV